jgi:hypothetical protein
MTPARKRARPFSANAASRNMLESDGWTVGKVDQSVNTGKFVFTRDLWGFGDLLATSPSRGNLIVQATAGKSTSNFHARVRKVRENPIVAIWLAHPSNRVQVHGWHGKGSKRQCQILEITMP